MRISDWSSDVCSSDLEQRRAYALELINNPLWPEVIEDMKQDAMNLWKRTTAADVQAREQAWQKFQAIEGVQNGIESALRRADAALAETTEQAAAHWATKALVA